MQRRHWIALGLVLLPVALVCLAVGLTSRPAASRPELRQAAWTILIYMAADCDLEACQINNVEIMLEAETSPDVNVVLLLDRSSKGEADRSLADIAEETSSTTARAPHSQAGADSEDNYEDDPAYTNRPLANVGNWSGAKLLCRKQGRLEQIADWGPVNMGDPAVLKRFIDTATQKYPATRYALILNDHGLGWSGACHDETHDDILTTPELRAVLSQAVRRIGKLELLGFDACLMANFEVCQSLGPFARVLVASEELEPGEGWNYVPLFNELAEQPTATGLEMGEMIAETFRRYFAVNDDSEATAITLSVIDSEKLEPVELGVNRLADALRSELAANPEDAWLRVARARARTVEFGREESREGASHLDLVHLCQLLGKEFPRGPVQDACRSLTEAVNGAVVRNIHSAEHLNSHGLMIFFPATREIFEDDLDVSYRAIEFSRRGRWCGWLADYIDRAEQHEFQPLLRELRVSAPKLAEDRPIIVSSGIDNDEFDEVYLALATGEGHDRTVLSQVSTNPDENGLLNENWNGQWYTLECGAKQCLCPLLTWRDTAPRGKKPVDKKAGQEIAGKTTEQAAIAREGSSRQQPSSDPKSAGKPIVRKAFPDRQTGDKKPADELGTLLAEVPAQIRHKGHATWTDVWLVFEFSQPANLGGHFVEAHTAGRHVRVLSLNRGDELRLLRGAIAGDGRRKLIPVSDQPAFDITEPRELRVGRQPLPPGKYQIGYVVSNLAGNFEEEYIDVELVPGKAKPN